MSGHRPLSLSSPVVAVVVVGPRAWLIQGRLDPTAVRLRRTKGPTP